MYVEKHSNAWWIMGHNPVMGPYSTKAEAEDEMRGVARFYEAIKKERNDR